MYFYEGTLAVIFMYFYKGTLAVIFMYFYEGTLAVYIQSMYFYKETIAAYHQATPEVIAGTAAENQGITATKHIIPYTLRVPM